MNHGRSRFGTYRSIRSGHVVLLRLEAFVSLDVERSVCLKFVDDFVGAERACKFKVLI